MDGNEEVKRTKGKVLTSLVLFMRVHKIIHHVAPIASTSLPLRSS